MTNKISWLIIHHSASSRDKTTYDMVKAWHKAKFGINGIGYDYLITKNKLYKGLGNAHTRGYNDTGIGICLTGNFMTEKPNAYQLKTLKKLAQDYYNKYKLKIVGHRDLGKTACPGDNLYKLLPHLLTKPMMKALSKQLKKILQRTGKYKTSTYKTILKWTQKHFIDWQSRTMPDFDKQIKNLKKKISILETENKGLKNNKTIKLSEESIGEIVKAIFEKFRTLFITKE